MVFVALGTNMLAFEVTLNRTVVKQPFHAIELSDIIQWHL